MTAKTKISDAEALTSITQFDPSIPDAVMRDRSATADIRAAKALADHATALVGHAVAAARAKGCTWAEIGLALEMTPQGARQRYA